MKTIAILITTYFLVFAAGFCSGAYMVYFSDKAIIISSANNGLRMIDQFNAPELPSMLVEWAVVVFIGILILISLAIKCYGKRRKGEDKRGDTPKRGAL